MKFRYSRHTNNLDTIIEFYTQIIGLEILGRFNNHANYNGVFLGLQNLDWHLEFTESDKKAKHYPDEDDLLVFYVNSTEEIDSIKRDAEKFGFNLIKSKNPYWRKNSIQINDPDGFGVVLSLNNK